MAAYACRIIPENFGVIASEKPDFDRPQLEEWLREHEIGYFLRDPDSQFDCQYFDPTVFLQLYEFVHPSDTGALFREVKALV